MLSPHALGGNTCVFVLSTQSEEMKMSGSPITAFTSKLNLDLFNQMSGRVTNQSLHPLILGHFCWEKDNGTLRNMPYSRHCLDFIYSI